MAYVRRGYSTTKGPSEALRWPDPIPELMRKVRALDAMVAKHELCNPTAAHSARLEATAVLTEIENAKTQVLVSELNASCPRA
jgi:hypothetical protein